MKTFISALPSTLVCWPKEPISISPPSRSGRGVGFLQKFALVLVYSFDFLLHLFPYNINKNVFEIDNIYVNVERKPFLATNIIIVILLDDALGIFVRS